MKTKSVDQEAEEKKELWKRRTDARLHNRIRDPRNQTDRIRNRNQSDRHNAKPL